MQLYVRVPIYSHSSISVCFGILVFFYFCFDVSITFFFVQFFVFPFRSYAFLWHIKPYGFDLPFLHLFLVPLAMCRYQHNFFFITIVVFFFFFLSRSYILTHPMAMYILCIYYVTFGIWCASLFNACHETFTQSVSASFFLDFLHIFVFYRSIVNVFYGSVCE